jgi:hypothetical protein
MCCGRPRRVGGLVTGAPVRAAVRVLEYLGRSSLVVTGPATRVVYRFAGPGARVRVDGRDAGALLGVGVLRDVG